MATLEIYLTKAEKDELLKISKKTGIPMSQLLLKGFSYWLSNNPEALKEEAEIFKGLMEEREAKRRETDLGDYIGSFKKFKEKLNEYEKARDKGEISEQEYKKYVKLTKKNYETTQRAKRKRFGTDTYEDRLKEFKESHKDIIARHKHDRKKS